MSNATFRVMASSFCEVCRSTSLVTGDNVTSVSSLDVAYSSNVYFYGRYCVFVVEAIIIVVANILTLIAVKQTKKLRQIPTNTFIVSLASADGIIGLLSPGILLISRTDSQTLWIISACVVRGPYYAVFCISLFTLLAIAVDRYMAIVHPLVYRKRMTVRIARHICLVIWLIQVILWEALACYYGSEISIGEYRPGSVQDLFPLKIFFLLMAEMSIPVLGNIALYSCIYITLRRKQASVSGMSRNNFQSSYFNHPSAKTKAFTKMMVFVLGYLLFAWLPFSAIVWIHRMNDPTTPIWYIYTFDAVSVLLYSNSFMNPVIYSWKNRDFREAYAKPLSCKRSTISRDDIVRGSGTRCITTSNL